MRRASRFSRPAVAAFETFFRPWMRARLRGPFIRGPRPPVGDRPLLLVANHVSWWDGFIVREVQRQIRPGAPLFTLMSRGELDRHPYFRWMGAVGIGGGSVGAVRGGIREFEARLFDTPAAVGVVFPQGAVWPAHRRPLGFRRGIELLGDRGMPLLVPMAIHLEPLNRLAPAAFVALGHAVDGAIDVRDLEARVERELDRIVVFVAEWGEDAPDAWRRMRRMGRATGDVYGYDADPGGPRRQHTSSPEGSGAETDAPARLDLEPERLSASAAKRSGAVPR